MTLLADLEEFVRDHRPHGGMTGDATQPAWNGYRLIVGCACGVVLRGGLRLHENRAIRVSNGYLLRTWRLAAIIR
jgi:cobalamin biosynthesis protein CbiG